MKPLIHHDFDARACRKELNEFSKLLLSKNILDEQKDILPFFKKRRNISMLISSYFPVMISPNVLNYEYSIQGHFSADLIIGDTTNSQYLFIEFENGASNSIFRKVGRKATLEWSSRFEHAFSQIVDWVCMLEDARHTTNFLNVFGKDATFQGLIILGKDVKNSHTENSRLKWRMDRVLVDSRGVSIVTFDQLYIDLNSYLKRFYSV